MKTYLLFRKEDVSGMSGTGHVAQVAEFDDGTVAVRWIATMNATGVSSTTIFSSVADVLRVHGHDGKTVVELVHDHELLRRTECSLGEARSCLGAAVELLEQHGIEPSAELRARVAKVLDCGGS